ncbi:MAG: inositol monophosphatase family protein [Methanomicrobiales archaeon]
MAFLSACNHKAADVEESIFDQVGTSDGGKTVRMGAALTQTQLIDQVAEDCTLRFLEKKSLCKLLISDEAEKVDIIGEKGTIFLDHGDGTFNAVAGIPFCAISIAYGDKGTIKQASVRDLSPGETFTTIWGKFDTTRMVQLGQKIRCWRLFGASALELCYVGCEKIDGFIDLRDTLRITDAAASMLVCTESGGKLSDLNGEAILFPNEVTIYRSIVATNGAIHHNVIEYLR